MGDQMGDERVDENTAARLRELWETPVGRRWLLKAGLGSAAVVGAQLYAGPAVAAAQRLRTRVPAGELQFALGALPGVTDLTVVANGARIPLRRHTKTSRAALRQRGGLWGVADLSALTHHVSGMQLPQHQALLVSVHGRRGSEDVVVSQLWHVPSSATIALATVAHQLKGTVAEAMGDKERLRRLGIELAAPLLPADVALLDTIGDADQAAIALISVHPNIATRQPTEAAVTKSLLARTPAVTTLGKKIAQLQQAGTNYANLVTAVDADGKPAEIQIPVKGGPPVVTTFQSFKLNDDAPGLSTAMTDAVVVGVKGVRDTEALGAVIDQPLDKERTASTKTWVQPVGVLPRATPVSRALKGSGIDIKVKNEGLNYGTYVTVDGTLTDGKLPLKLYNNYVRWVSVYVQYLGAGGKTIPNQNPAPADTKYAQYLGMMPQVFTLLGVPIWDSNTIEATLQFPEGAHGARLLMCGLGASDRDGGWRQYFPADAYPDSFAPSDEVLTPAILTGVMTIGLTAFALATDFDVALAWKGVNREITDALKEPDLLWKIFYAIVRGIGVSTSQAEAATLSALFGHTELKLGTLWRLLENLASLIPKIIFSPSAATLFIRIAADLAEAEAEDKLLDSIPIIGQVLAVIAAAGDLATLAEAIGETIASPWVIENEVNLSYETTVTIDHDPDNSTWPKTARSWRLEALVDGALTLDPITGSINDGGKIRSDPLTLDVTAPFGGKQIQWSFVALDGSNRQVGTGASGTFPNDDPTKPAKIVKFQIKELPATITSSTVFKRADTTAYDAKAGGYSWSDQVAVNGTVAADDAQDVAGTAVATLAGVAGVVFKAQGLYYVRGVPVAQNGNTITLGVAPKEGFARRPFVLLDPFVHKTDRTNHVLLEPDDNSAAYHVRALSLDPATGALSWDRSTSLGTFVLPVSAAALHSSGRVVTVDTASGRLGRLQPVNTPQPMLASYSAGPGTQVGLLSDPVALAVTNPGVVLVLEAGTSQLSAFDLNGNPVRYFTNGTNRQAQFTRALVSSGTPLDLAVDGANQIYVLY
ncbi:MAG TPA: hypothetical protein VFW09_19615 [Solirubrobacteraceae bacterium]|nr:hypothetical protein [Solirubrobacteraceae bacterium]